jgi:hypothetical protein
MVRETLERPVNLQVKDAPLAEVIGQLKKITSLPILLDRRAMANLGVDLATPVTLDASNRTLRAILDEMAHQHGLAWTFDHEVLLVTTPEEEECLLETRAYDIGDLLSYHNNRGENAPDFDAIIGMIEVSIEPTHWDDTGGAGSIGAFEGDAIHAIVVRQAWHIQLKLESLLANLRQVRGHARNEEHIEKLPPVHRTPKPGMDKGMM